MTSLSGVYRRIGGGVTETRLSAHKHFADCADSCSLITSPVCCQVILVGCIFFIVLFTGPIVLLRFVSVLFPLICVLLPTVNVYEAKLLFVSDYFIYLNIMLNNFPISFFLSMHKTKILILLVNISCSC